MQPFDTLNKEYVKDLNNVFWNTMKDLWDDKSGPKLWKEVKADLIGDNKLTVKIRGTNDTTATCNVELGGEDDLDAQRKHIVGLFSAWWDPKWGNILQRKIPQPKKGKNKPKPTLQLYKGATSICKDNGNSNYEIWEFGKKVTTKGEPTDGDGETLWTLILANVARGGSVGKRCQNRRSC